MPSPLEEARPYRIVVGEEHSDPEEEEEASEDDEDLAVVKLARRSALAARMKFTPPAKSLAAGTFAVMGSTSSGDVPQVTTGAMSSPLMVTTLSKCAPSSVNRVFQ